VKADEAVFVKQTLIPTKQARAEFFCLAHSLGPRSWSNWKVQYRDFLP
jgi:hypothetical protein